MNKIAKLLCGAAVLGMMASCSDDAPKAGSIDSKGNMFASLTLQMPNSSRSATQDQLDPTGNTNSDGGYEVGKAYENHVGAVLVVLAKGETTNNITTFTYLTSSIADGQVTTADDNTTNDNDRVTYNVTFRNEELEEGLGEEVYVFAFCNPTDELKENVKDVFNNTNGFGTLNNADNAYIWTKQRFLMMNRDLATHKLPTTQEITETYHDAEHPFSLGTVYVERAAVRFDFKPTTMDGQEDANVYPVYELGTTNVMANVRFSGMSLFNEAKEFYYLPRVGKYEGYTLSDEQICGAEISTNWIVSPNQEFKLGFAPSLDPDAEATTPNYAGLSEKYFYALGASGNTGFDPRSLTFTSISSLTEEDNAIKTTDVPGYYIWRYASENTLPGINAQVHATTTGVVFQAFLEAVEGTELATAMDAHNDIYALNGTVYGDKAMVEAYIANSPASFLNDQWQILNQEDNLNPDGSIMGSGVSEITIYRYDETLGGYPMYYYYYNRHNDNLKAVTMGTMEFATVRNNVYKLSVSDVLHLGHPGDPSDDPDPEDPDDPDESPNVYFKVDIEVLPWVVRINDTKF